MVVLTWIHHKSNLAHSRRTTGIKVGLVNVGSIGLLEFLNNRAGSTCRTVQRFAFSVYRTGLMEKSSAIPLLLTYVDDRLVNHIHTV